MASIPIIMPQLGESIAEATIVRFLVKPGDVVVADQEIVEVETNKATTALTAPAAGKIERFVASENESYPVGATLGYVAAEGENSSAAGASESNVQDRSPEPAAEYPQVKSVQPGHATTPQSVKPTVEGLPVPAEAAGVNYMSPRMKARMIELGLGAVDLAGLPGSGAAGRVTIKDFELFIANLEKQRTSAASSMRVAVADAMRRSWTRPLATVALPVCFDPLLNHRRQSNPKPGPALYALRALALALAENSAPAGRLIGNKIVHPSAIDVGFAVEAQEGVLVPVIRDAHKRWLKDLVERYNELIELAHRRKLPADATGGSIATVTNFGTFGLTWATPIPLPEQTLVLGMGAARRVPQWDEEEGQFVPITEANVTLSFDHRVLDGGAAGRLLARIAQLLGTPEKL